MIFLTTGFLGLSACASAPTGKDVACHVFQPITWSRSDTKPTIRQIVGHNGAGKELCGWKPAK